MFKNFFKLIIYFIGFVAVGAVAVFFIFKLIEFNRTVDVPLLIGKGISEARTLLDDKGLSLEIEGEEYDENIPAGYIISQDIVQGNKVKKHSNITVVVSKGKSMFIIPDFEGMDIKDVELTLMKSDLPDRQSGLKIVKITRVHSDTVEKDMVIAQRPLPGGFGDNKVSLLVSLGPYDVSYKCPLFIELTVDEARKLAQTLGLKLVEYESGNVVVFQKPDVDTIIKRGETVEITLGRGRGFWF